jgi:hypothetical protein
MQFHYLTHEDVPDTLYHYTSLEALVAIVQSKRLRASNIRFLNDTSEALRLKEDVIGILQKRFSSSEEDREIVNTLIHSIQSRPSQSLFVASLSENSDLLSQWRAYCPSGLGVSIGFSGDSLNEQFVANPRGDKPFFLSARLQKVRYYESSHLGELEATMEKLLEFERKAGTQSSKYPNFNVMNAVFPMFKGTVFQKGELDEILKLTIDKIREVEGDSDVKLCPVGSAMAGWVFLLSPFIKHSAFKEECEWRKVVSKDFRPMPGQKFRMGKSTLIPFVEIMLDVRREGAECVPREKYFINEVIVGPTPTPDLTLEALRSLFDSEGHPDVTVRSSRIPFKDW